LTGKIRVLVVDDSLVVREMITRILNKAPDIEVVGVAVNGKDAVLQTAKLRPDFITMDIRMPVMDGFQATEQIMAYYPTPILVFSASIHEAELRIAFRALAEGALDVMEKPSMEEDWSNLSNIANELINRVRILSSARVIAHPKGRLKADHPLGAAVGQAQFRVVAIGSSTGGPGALSKILPRISPQLSAGIVIAQHISQSFVRGLVRWLDEVSIIKVKEAEEGESVRAGVALISPADYHMTIGAGGTVRLVDPSEKEGIIPSADLLLSSAAAVFGAQAIGVILTGMGSDGAEGLKKIKESGGTTLAQDESSSIVYGMPRVAIETGAAQRVVCLDSIAEEITNLVSRSYLA
jgi:two-component system chemotaxis response regulator CheB